MSDFYGLDGWEYVEPDIEMAVERVIEEACEPIGEGFDAIADRLEWPLEIKLYRDTGDEWGDGWFECEPTGEVVKVTREEARKMCGEVKE